MKRTLQSFLIFLFLVSYTYTFAAAKVCNGNRPLFYAHFGLINSGEKVAAIFASYVSAQKCSEEFEMMQKQYTIEFGEVIGFEVQNSTGAPASWQLIKDQKVIQSGSGNQTGSLPFNIPGNYKVVFSALGANHHLHADSATVNVLSTKLKFNIAKAKLSKGIKQQDSIKGVTLTIPVEVFSYFGAAVSYGPFKGESSGIAGVAATLKEPLKLLPGTHEIKYEVTGIVKSSGPAQIGFFSPLGEGYFYNFIISKSK